MTEQKSTLRVPELDGIRGLAICMVVFHHYAMCAAYPRGSQIAAFIERTFALSWTGVDLFFVLSGFLIGGILMDNRSTENYFRTFYIRRACRIFPLYFVWLMLAAVLPLGLSAFSSQDWFSPIFSDQPPWWSHVLFIQNLFVAKTGIYGGIFLGGTWSLAVEEQFYLVLPLLVWLLPARKLPLLLVALIFTAPLLRLLLCCWSPHYPQAAYQSMPCRSDALLLGGLCAWLVRQAESLRWLRNNQRFLNAVFALLLAGAIVINFWFDSRSNFAMVFFGYSWLALLYAVLLLLAFTGEPGGIIRRWFRSRPLGVMGTIAYGIYILHQPIISLVHGLIRHQAVQYHCWQDVSLTLLALGLTLGGATLSWVYFEKPLILWGHSFTYRKTSSASRGSL